jgi:hypothetical protein
VHIRFPDASATLQITGVDQLPGKSNYFIGNDPGKWHRDITTYAKVRYQDVYPGIDLIYHGSWGQVEYDFVVAPGADPKSIRVAFPRVAGVRIDSQGKLVLNAGGGELRFHKPVVYQDGLGGRQFVEGAYLLDASKQVRFQIGHYDARKPLVIDPVLSYSTYLGGSGDDFGYGIAVDSAGNAYITGQTVSTNFPTANPVQPANAGGIDAFVAALDPTGSTLLYSTYLGGSGEDVGYGIGVDSAGNAYVTGWTKSTNFPTANPFQPAYGGGFYDAFVTALDHTGSVLLYSTYLGGNDVDVGFGIAVDSAGNAYVTGYTGSNNFPTANPLQPTNGGIDAFVTKLDATGSMLLYSTYLGGSDGDYGYGIALDGAGSAYVTGVTLSTNFPTANPVQPANGGSQDAFVAEINPTGATLLFSTYLGGSGDDGGYGIAVSAGKAYVTGWTDSTNFPTANPLQPTYGGGVYDAFVTALDPTRSTLLYSTYLGGNAYDRGGGIGVDSAGNAYVVGDTTSTNFPVANPLQPTFGGLTDAFVAELDSTGSTLLYSSYLGGAFVDLGYGIAIDSAGNAYVTGRTLSHDFPTANPLQPTNAGGADTFVAKLTQFSSPVRRR